IEKAREEFGFVSATSVHADRLSTIKDVQERYNYLVDPHTADGVKAARDAQAEHNIETSIIVLETALPLKFAETIEEPIREVPATPERFAHVRGAHRFGTDLPNVVGGVMYFSTCSIQTSEVQDDPMAEQQSLPEDYNTQCA